MSLREAGAARVKCQSEGAIKHFWELWEVRTDPALHDTVLCSAIQCKQVPDYNTRYRDRILGGSDG